MWLFLLAVLLSLYLFGVYYTVGLMMLGVLALFIIGMIAQAEGY